MNLVRVGYFSRSHGTKGHVVLKLETELETEGLDLIFLEIGGSSAPYFVQEIKWAGNDAVLKLEGIDGPEAAKSLLNKPVSADAKHVIQEEDDDLSGYELIEKQLGSLGQVKELSNNGTQDLIHLIYKGKEVILPLVDAFVVAIDQEKRQIHYTAPEGLIDLYLEEP